MKQNSKVQTSDRRSFFKTAGLATLGGAAAAYVVGGARPALAQQPAGNFRFDTPAQIFTAALIAEDLATTFYYNGLTGKVIQDPNLAGAGGTATTVTSSGNAGNVQYLQAALSEEISHANLMRTLLGGTAASADPVQMFYLPTGCFDTLTSFLGVLDALENAFIGAYLEAVRGFAFMSALLQNGNVAGYTLNGVGFNAQQVQYYSQVCASIMGVEAEHRVLGRVIGNSNPANNVCYEQTDGLDAVYNGSTSAVAALTPFLSPGTGLTGYSFASALAGQAAVAVPCTGGLPPL